MPELPEVEHVVRALRPVVVGRRILAAELNLKRISPEISRPAFARQLKDLRINAVGRRGKYILFELDSGALLTTHLRMTGKFVALQTDEEMPPYAHVVFYLDDDRRLVFCDMDAATSPSVRPRIALTLPGQPRNQPMIANTTSKMMTNAK